MPTAPIGPGNPGTVMADELDPDRLAELEREQAFLLTSLDDLDAEAAAGDMDPADHQALTDDYTRRLAEVSRAIDGRRAAFAQVDNRLSATQRVLTLAGAAVLALVVGLVLARAVGFRSPTDSISGGIRQSTAGLLAEADTLTREGRWDEAIQVYDQALEQAPANAEALTYRGWLKSRTGRAADAANDLDEAVAVDRAYPDARVFRAIVAADDDRYDDAAQDLAVLGTLDPPTEIVELVDGFGLGSRVAKGQLVERFSSGEAVDLSQISGDLADQAGAAIDLIADDPTLAVRALTAVLDEDPDQLSALVAKGNLLGTSTQVAELSPETAAEGLALLDRAVELAPEVDEIRFYRAVSRSLNGDLDGARSDVDQIDRAALPESLTPQFDAFAAGL